MSLVLDEINDTGMMQVTWAVHWDTIHLFTLNLSWDTMYESVASKMTLNIFCKKVGPIYRTVIDLLHSNTFFSDAAL